MLESLKTFSKIGIKYSVFGIDFQEVFVTFITFEKFYCKY